MCLQTDVFQDDHNFPVPGLFCSGWGCKIDVWEPSLPILFKDFQYREDRDCVSGVPIVGNTLESHLKFHVLLETYPYMRLP